MYKVLKRYAHIWELGTSFRQYVRAYKAMRECDKDSCLYEVYRSQAFAEAHTFAMIVRTALTMAAHYDVDIPCDDLADLMDISDSLLHRVINS